MSSKSLPALTVRSVELPADTRVKISRGQFRQTRSDATIIFFVFAFVGFGLAGVARLLWFHDMPTIYSAGIATTCGLIASAVMGLLHAITLAAIRNDLEAGACSEATVRCGKAIRVRFTGSPLEGVALECGDDTLILIGGWWRQKNRPSVWAAPESRDRFPARAFRIRFLPRSGRVITVHVEDGPLPVDERDPIEPLVSLEFPKHAEVVHVDRPLDSLLVDRTGAPPNA